MSSASCLSNGSNKFVISKGLPNTFTFTIKANGTTLPIEIAPTDTFKATFFLLEDRTVVLTKDLTVKNALGGTVELTLSPQETATFTSFRGGKEDRYYLIPAYSLVIECVTVANGNFLAKVPQVYVE